MKSTSQCASFINVDKINSNQVFNLDIHTSILTHNLMFILVMVIFCSFFLGLKQKYQNLLVHRGIQPSLQAMVQLLSSLHN